MHNYIINYMVCNYYMVLARIKVNMSENVLEINMHV